jgi:proline iminopeptidase
MLIQTSKRNKIPQDTLYVEYKRKDPKQKRRTVICLPGGPGGDHSIYKAQWEKFFPIVDVVLFDPRGCGQSTSANNNCYDMSIYIDDVEDIRKYLELDDVIILGTSYGSMAALGYAIKYSKDGYMNRLICVNGAPSYEFINSAKNIIKDIGTEEQQQMFSRLLQGDLTKDDDLKDYFNITGSLYSTSAQKDSATHHDNSDVRYNADAVNAGFAPGGFLTTFDWREQLHTITCPTLIVVGDKDWINYRTNTDQMAEHIPNNIYSIVSDCGHLIWIDQPEKYYQLATEFIKKIA